MEKTIESATRRLGFITAIPQSVHRGSGCYVGIATLAAGLRAAGHHVEIIHPSFRLGSLLAERYLFNRSLAFRKTWDFDALAGFDLDGFALPPVRVPRIANIKGVLADAVRFERGITRAAIALEARWEGEHARRADLVITISEYCKERIRDFYRVRGPIAVVPELIDLDGWKKLFAANPAIKPADEFTVLCVCRFYPRKRVGLLLEAAGILRDQIPGLRIRIVGGGPEAARLRTVWRQLRLDSIVTWVGETSRGELAQEYNRADIFCLPSVQEGFGIAFLEAMAAGKPIVAARAAAVPEVVRHGVLTEPESAEALAEGIRQLWSDPLQSCEIARRQKAEVERYEMGRVAARFLHALAL
ncbi:MAG TPA: glycosyltransferase family 4 protein [Bryobacteraceae bacterium]|nr:glycosyltransferase family 4 protein [Bryobacteraceae bacterium]